MVSLVSFLGCLLALLLILIDLLLSLLLDWAVLGFIFGLHLDVGFLSLLLLGLVLLLGLGVHM